MPGNMPRASPASFHGTHIYNDHKSTSPLRKLRLWNLSHVAQLGGGRKEYLLSSFQLVEDNTDLQAPLPTYSIFLPALIPHTRLLAPKVTPPSPMLDVRDDLKSIY